ncbi:MAG: hypothetical protein EOO12_13865, partial [Chitinophagaceae bacterium]
MRNRTIPNTVYVLSDYTMAALSWALFYFVRKVLLNEPVNISEGHWERFWLGTMLIPLGWLALFTVGGSYGSVYKKSRFGEFTQTFIGSLLGSIVLFFVFLLDDVRSDYTYYYAAFGCLLGLHFVLLFTGRLLILQRAHHQLRRGEVSFPALIVATGEEAQRLQLDTAAKLRDEGYRIVGYLSLLPSDNGRKGLRSLGHIGQLESVLEAEAIRCVILGNRKTEVPILESLVDRLSERDVEVKMPPTTLDILAGSVKTSNVMGPVLMDIKTGLMPEWQQNSKRLI